MNIVSYNLNFNRAFTDLVQLVETYSPDILCLQECDDKKMPSKVGNVSLVKTTDNSPGDGLAIYANTDILIPNKHATHAFSKSLLLYNTPHRERLIVCVFTVKKTGQTFVIGNLHATHLVATNKKRRNEIEQSATHIKNLAHDRPFVLIGDFNYPIFNNRLKKWGQMQGLVLHKSDSTTYRSSYFKGHFDKVMSYKISNATVKTLPFAGSDHAPISLTFEL